MLKFVIAMILSAAAPVLIVIAGLKKPQPKRQAEPAPGRTTAAAR